MLSPSFFDPGSDQLILGTKSILAVEISLLIHHAKKVILVVLISRRALTNMLTRKALRRFSSRRRLKSSIESILIAMLIVLGRKVWASLADYFLFRLTISSHRIFRVKSVRFDGVVRCMRLRIFAIDLHCCRLHSLDPIRPTLLKYIKRSCAPHPCRGSIIIRINMQDLRTTILLVHIWVIVVNDFFL